ncbi:hypothetical protein XENTR_v10004818 [Xenopus tropicalis]|nr:hypothetical protein XENTR_v10004818 [Xenopus tropicalis]
MEPGVEGQTGGTADMCPMEQEEGLIGTRAMIAKLGGNGARQFGASKDNEPWRFTVYDAHQCYCGGGVCYYSRGRIGCH